MNDVRVVLETQAGAIEILVHVHAAPLSAHAFLVFVDNGTFSQHGVFYRTVRRNDNDHGSPPIDIIQGGLWGRPQGLDTVRHESTRGTGLRHLDGTVSLARGDPGSATGAAFFICIDAQPALDDGGMRKTDGQGFAAFGRVVNGMQNVRHIHAQPSGGAAPTDYQAGQILQPHVRILRATRIPYQSQ